MMDGRKVARFKLGNGEWRSKVYYSQPEKENEEKDETLHPPQTATSSNSVWSKPKYDTEKYAGYIESLMGIEKEKTTKNKTLFNRKINVSWGKLQPELATEEHEFATEAHKFTKQQLIDTLNNDNATENIERLSKMSREEVESEYKSTNRLALSNKDDIENRVNNAFLKGEGLEDITINGQKYKGLLFDENSEQSKRLKKSDVFEAYYNNYLSKVSETINDAKKGKEINVNTLSNTLKTELGKPDFSTFQNLWKHDYFGLMGGIQKVDIDFKITPVSETEYKLQTTMYLTDWYGADKDDISMKLDYKNIAITTAYAMSNPTDFNNVDNYKKNMENITSNYKSIMPGLQEFFYLQHHYGCKPFPTQIIYKSTDTIMLD
ncbi:MAG: hypothetical protein R3Y04_01805 [Rikenellaceae bacterium]